MGRRSSSGTFTSARRTVPPGEAAGGPAGSGVARQSRRRAGSPCRKHAERRVLQESCARRNGIAGGRPSPDAGCIGAFVTRSEGNVVVDEFAVDARFGFVAPARLRGGSGPAHVALGAAAAAAQHLHLAGDDLRGVAVVAVLVLPLARLEPAFHVDLRALLEVLDHDLGHAAEEDDAVPLGPLLLFAG